jgi:hypothetical protein
MILNSETSNNLPNFTDLIISKLPTLLESAPYHGLQWLSTLVICNIKIHNWCLDNLKFWCKPYLIAHKQTNIRFTAAVLLANLVPNKIFRDSYSANRNMYIPFKPPHQQYIDNNEALSSSSSSSSSLTTTPTSTPSKQAATTPATILNFDFNSSECKTILHKIIEHLFMYMNELTNFADKDQHAHNTRLVQYFAFLIFSMCGREEKLLFRPFILNFWSNFFPIISNIHTVSNLNKQAALHFFYQSLVSCYKQRLPGCYGTVYERMRLTFGTNIQCR